MFLQWLNIFQRKPIMIHNKKFRLKATINQEIIRGNCVLLFYVDIVKLTEIENRYGDMVAKKVLQRFEKALFQVSKGVFEIIGKVLAIQKLWGDDFAIYVSFPKGSSEEDYRLLSISFQEQVESVLNQSIAFVNREEMRVHIGYAFLPGQDIVKEMYTSVKHAVHMAKYGVASEKYTFVTQYHRILSNEAVHMNYMPIVSLADGMPLGWEALARGPENTPFYSPAKLFSYAEETDSVFRLEHICRKRALEQLKYLKPHEKLFINLDPRAIDDPFLLRGKVLELLDESGLHPSNIVFEITERHAIANYSVFRKIIEEYRKKGYLIAVDDAGAGYSSLETIAEIYPEYIKLDMSLIRNIDIDSIKQALLETFVQFADKVKCKIIAEGIENERELEALIELGVSYGQGFYLGKPNKGLTLVNGAAMNYIRLSHDRKKEINGFEDPFVLDLGDIITKAICVDKETKVRQIHQIFENNHRVESIVILDSHIPVGLVMRGQLYQTLGGQYGIPLYYERSITHIMNKTPLVVRNTEKLEEVAKKAMARDNNHIYDVIIVTDQTGVYVGIVSVHSLLDKMTNIKLEKATFANPLTGLPGNVRIERELMDRVKQERDFVVIYCDLDRFKWFNDQYGFEVGDQIIRQTAHLLQESIRMEGNNYDFIGHIGGDDYIIITTPERVASVTQYIIQSFDSYYFDIYEKCKIKSGCEPSLSLSMAGVTCMSKQYKSFVDISEKAAYIKKIAKKYQGTIYISDTTLSHTSVENVE